MMRRLPALAAAVSLSLGFLVTPAFAQGTSRPQYSDKDKQKLAEIAKRPEVIQQVDSAWESIRRQDMEFAFRVNTAADLGDWRNNPQWLEVWSKYGRLYDNPILVNYVNSLGQRLVAKDSPHLYAFRLLLDPTPRAEALSTGTIYVSTGLVSLLDNEAQLAYVLAHEVAHVERNHMYETIRNDILENELNKELEKSADKKKAIFGMAAAIGGGMLGAKLGDSSGAAAGAMTGLIAGAVVGNILFRNKFEPTRWSALHETEADEAGLNALIDQRFDVREVPKVYTRLAGLVQKDKRVGLGFIGDADRLKQRTAYVEAQITGALKGKIDATLDKGGLTGSSAEFSVLMAALKRDNGVIAMDYDLMPMAKENLVDAEKIRSNDPRVQYYLGRLYAMTGRTAEEKQEALTHLQNAIRYDGERGSFPEPHLQYALHLIAQNNPASQKEIQDSLKQYVTLYQREHAGQLPNNMHIIYDYLLMAGDQSYYAPPVSVIATRENQPIPVVTTVATAAPTPAAPAPKKPAQPRQ
jgi:outer membrane lipoprotein SlyB